MTCSLYLKYRKLNDFYSRGSASYSCIHAWITCCVVITWAHRVLAYFNAISCSSLLKSASASPHKNGCMFSINASAALIRQPICAYTPQIISWSRPESRMSCSSGENLKTLYLHLVSTVSFFWGEIFGKICVMLGSSFKPGPKSRLITADIQVTGCQVVLYKQREY